MPRASTQNARPALRRLPTRPSRMVQARGALAQGRYPLVVAPEGATNNLSGEDGSLGAGGGPAGVLGR